MLGGDLERPRSISSQSIATRRSPQRADDRPDRSPSVARLRPSRADHVGHLVAGSGREPRPVAPESRTSGRGRRAVSGRCGILGRDPDAGVEQEHAQRDSRSSRISFAASPPIAARAVRAALRSSLRRRSALAGLELALGQAPQEAAAGLVGSRSSVGVDPLERARREWRSSPLPQGEYIRYCQRLEWRHAPRSLRIEDAHVARTTCQLRAQSGARKLRSRRAAISTRSTSPSGICRKRVPSARKDSASPVQRKR